MTIDTHSIRRIGGSTLAVAGALLTNLLGWGAPAPAMTLGVTIGLTYGLLAVGLVLVYRSSRIINFAHGEVGAFAAAPFGLASANWGLTYYLILPLAVLIGSRNSGGHRDRRHPPPPQGTSTHEHHRHDRHRPVPRAVRPLRQRAGRSR